MQLPGGHAADVPSDLIPEDYGLMFVLPAEGASMDPLCPVDWTIYVEATTRRQFQSRAEAWLTRRLEGGIHFLQIPVYSPPVRVAEVCYSTVLL
jgi:hypothetical protein